MPRTVLPIEQILTLLVTTPPRLAALSTGLEPARLRASPDPATWSATDVLAHLRACADVWGDCMMTMIANDKPTLRAVNPLTWIKQTDYRDLEFQPSLLAYTTQRNELLAILQPLPPNDWSRTATVTGAGKVLERTVLFYGDWLARHERQHVKQVERILAPMRA